MASMSVTWKSWLQGTRGDLVLVQRMAGLEMGWGIHHPWTFAGMSGGVILVNSARGALLVLKGGPETLGTLCTWCTCCTDPAGGARRQASQLRGAGLLGPWLSSSRVLPHRSAGPGFPLRNFLPHCMCPADCQPHLSPTHCILLPVTHSMWLPLTPHQSLTQIQKTTALGRMEKMRLSSNSHKTNVSGVMCLLERPMHQ